MLIFENIKNIQSIEGLVSIDTYIKGYYGGSGKLINLSNASKIIEKYNVILAGGLTPENIQAISQELNPWAVDVSSGVETDGVKDKDKIENGSLVRLKTSPVSSDIICVTDIP